MDNPLDRQYFEWLYSLVASVKQRNKSHTYRDLFRQLYSTEFLYFVPNDDNRAEDGRDLRIEFFQEAGLDYNDPEYQDWLDLNCSMLEMLIALSRRLEFEAGGNARDWFWHLLQNVNLSELNDRDGFSRDDVAETLNRVVFREYDPDGVGGLFPLHYSEKDQVEVELWYQLCSYVNEHT